MPRLIRVFAVRMKKTWVLSYPLSAKRRSDWVDAQAYLSLCWVHRSFCWFCHAVAHIQFDIVSQVILGNRYWKVTYIINNSIAWYSTVTYKCYIPEDQWYCNAHLRPKTKLIYFPSFLLRSKFDYFVKKIQRSSKGHHFGLLVQENNFFKDFNHIWGMVPILVMRPTSFQQTFVPQHGSLGDGAKDVSKCKSEWPWTKVNICNLWPWPLTLIFIHVLIWSTICYQLPVDRFQQFLDNLVFGFSHIKA